MAALPAHAETDAPDRVSFRDQILPLLSDRCFHCHGPDEKSREAGLRLDLRDPAVEDRGGYRAVDPENVEASELIARITSDDADLQMPPPEAGKKPLTEQDIELFRRWIAQGAEWEGHWSFERVERPTPPEVKDAGWVKNPVDRFVLAKLEANNVKPAEPAGKAALLRRASLSLTGLPPTTEELDAFLADDSADAYEKAVDRLLASPHYGERMAYNWLDLARYADSDGYQQDENRNNWPWRDWVVASYNRNKPFDEFTIEQFAGDLLPSATPDQVVATCFHRNHLTNGEGGRDPEESRVDYVIDRVNTIGTAWLGLTLGCVQCHTHKYDPITHNEYYELTAFFNSIDEDGRAGKRAKPYYDYPLPADSEYSERQRAPLRKAIADAERRAADEKRRSESRFAAWLAKHQKLVGSAPDSAPTWETIKPVEQTATAKKLKLKPQSDGSLFVSQEENPDRVDFYVAGKTSLPQVTAIRVEALPDPSHTAGGLARSNSGNIVLTDIEVRVRRAGKKDSLPLALASAEADYAQPGYNPERVIDGRADTGWAVWSGDIARPRSLVVRLKKPADVPPDALLVVRIKHQSKSAKHYLGKFRLSATGDAEPRLGMYSTPPLAYLRGAGDFATLPADQQKAVKVFFYDHDGLLGVKRGQVTRAELDLEAAKRDSKISVMVLKEREKPRDTFVLERGEWDQHGAKVAPGVPAALGALPEDAPRTRLTLARWIVDRDNPLTARVAINRYWQNLFGAGLVRTPEDFGLQGERPTHPGLLDWLAAEFMESGWDVKAVHRLIVTSATFRQSSRFRAELMERDPENRLVARGPRFPLPAPVLRDQALAASGLLTPDLGGPPVYPYQPKGVWTDANQGKYVYKPSTGEDLYRRSLYGFWRRNAAPPAMFDAAARRVCQVNVVRTNSPMHALNLLNDPTYVEASRALAEAAAAQELSTNEQRLAWAFRRVLGRAPTEQESTVLVAQHEALLAKFTASPDDARALLSVGASPVDKDAAPEELAALAATMSVVLNLDETLNLE